MIGLMIIREMNSKNKIHREAGNIPDKIVKMNRETTDQSDRRGNKNLRNKKSIMRKSLMTIMKVDPLEIIMIQINLKVSFNQEIKRGLEETIETIITIIIDQIM